MIRTRFSGVLLSTTAAVALALVLGACSTAGQTGSPRRATSAIGGETTSSTPGESGSGPSDTDDPADAWCSAVAQAEIRYARGTVAPPYHYEWTLSVTGTKATFTMQGGYDGDPAATWSRDFPVTRRQVADLCDATLRFGGDPGGGVGGDRSSYTITSRKPDDGPDHRQGDIRSPLDFGDYLLANLVPGQVWAGVNAQFQVWSFAQQAETDHHEPIPAATMGDPVAPADVPADFCNGTTSGRVAYSSRGPTRADQMEVLLTFAQGRAFLVVTPDFSGPSARWDAAWDLDPEQQHRLCMLALSTLQDAPAREPDARSPGFDIMLTGGGQTATGAGLDLTEASAPFMARLWGVAGDDVTGQTFGKWQAWVAEG